MTTEAGAAARAGTPTTPVDTQTRTQTLAVIAALAAGVIGGCAFAKMSPALPLLKHEFGLTLVQAGWLASVFNALAMLSAIFFGVFSDRVGALRFCLAGLACVAAGGTLGALSPDTIVLIVSRLIEGLGFIAIIVSAPGLIVAAIAPERRGLVFGFWSSYMPLGSALVLATSPLAIAAAGWRGIWAAVALAAAACALLLFSQRRHYAEVSRGTRRSLASIRASLAQPVPWWLGLAFALYTVQNVGVFLWLPTYLIETRGISPTNAALLGALSIFVNCFGNVLGGWLVQRKVPRGRIIGAAFIVAGVLFVGMFSAVLPDGARYALVLIYNAACGVIPAAALSGGARYARSPAEVGSIQGLIVQLTNVGIFFGPPLIATVVTYAHSWDAALWVMLAAAAAGLAVSRVIARYERCEQRA